MKTEKIEESKTTVNENKDIQKDSMPEKVVKKVVKKQDGSINYKKTFGQPSINKNK